MPVKIRLTRTGKKKQPSYRVVVMDSRKPRDGKYIEQIGRYDARQEPSLIEINNERALAWLHQGAQPTERAQKLLEISGAWAQFRVDKGEIHTIEDHRPQEYDEKSAIVEVLTEETSDQLPVASEEVTSDQMPVASEEETAEGVAEEVPEEAAIEDAVEETGEGAMEELVEEAVEEAKEELVEEAVEEAVIEAVSEAAEGEDSA
jgi:small subunit ribosomal protein S16